MMLKIKDLHAEVDGKAILKGVTLDVNEGEVHAIMGPNGSGKSTLANVLSGRDGYVVTHGEVIFNGEDLLSLSPDIRAQKGLFLGFQYPVEIPGVTNVTFLKAAYNAKRKAMGLPESDAMEFLSFMKTQMRAVDMDIDFLYRSVNADFSGGEKKRNEMLQMLVLEPSLCILDEVDSGLDVDALKVIGSAVTQLRDPKRAFIMITHYQRLLDHIPPDYVHILQNGKIVKSGNASLALEIEAQGYGGLN